MQFQDPEAIARKMRKDKRAASRSGTPARRGRSRSPRPSRSPPRRQSPPPVPPPRPPPPPAVVQPAPQLPATNHVAPATPKVTVGFPANLLASLRARGRLGHQLYVSQLYPGFTPLNVEFEQLRDSLARSVLPILKQRMLIDGRRQPSEIDAFINNVADPMRDMIGRALYARLRHIAYATGVNRGRFPDRPTYSKETVFPNPIARAINQLGLYRPIDMMPDSVYLPTVSADLANSGGLAANTQFAYYQHVAAELKKLEFLLAPVELREVTGSPWWLLQIETNPNNPERADVLATLPATNFSDTDVLTFILTLRDFNAALVPVQWHESHLEAASRLLGRYGSLLRHVLRSEVDGFIGADVGLAESEYLQAIAGLLP